uniref:Aminoglycoside phosphotransferase domain-containing protein n=2 Tax=Moniliophthora roreri TaxID=221103 RepID=A0A0W0FHU7_MONRR
MIHYQFLHFKLWLYFLCTHQHHELAPNTRMFRFGVPLVLKRTQRLFSTEADALSLLNRALPRSLFIPRLVDSFQIDDATWTVMTKLPGRMLIEVEEEKPLTVNEAALLAEDVGTVVEQLWNIPQPKGCEGQVMLSASGDGLPHPETRYHDAHPPIIKGPFPDTWSFYKSIIYIKYIAREQVSPDIRGAIVADKIGWVHTDLKMQNVLVDDKCRLTGIIDWEDSGWFPRHWQLYTFRLKRIGQRQGMWREHWDERYRFDSVTEQAYQASCKVVEYVP